jgi:DNA-binding response OmpR family regulator
MSQYTILLFIADLNVCRRLGWYLEYKGCQVLRAATGRALEEALGSREFDLILAQVERQDLKGLQFLHTARRLQPRAPMILVNATQEEAFPVQAYQLEVDDYISMDCRPEELWRRVAACLEKLPQRCQKAAGRSRLAPLNRAVVKKIEHVCQFLSYSLDSSMTILQSLINTPESRVDRQARCKIQEVSARMEVLQEMMHGFHRGIAGQEMARNFPRALQQW